MKKRMGFLAALVCVLAFGLVFVGCGSDSSSSSFSGPSVKDIPLSDLGLDSEGLALIYAGGDVPPSPADYTEAGQAFERASDVLRGKYDLFEDFIHEYVEDYMDNLPSTTTSLNKTFKITDIITSTSLAYNGKTFKANGIYNLSGTVNITGSGNASAGGYVITSALSHEYDSDEESPFSSYSGYRLYAKVKVSSIFDYSGSSVSETEIQTLRLSYAVAYADTDFCGLSDFNSGFKTTWSSKAPSWDDTYTVNSATGDVGFYDLTGKQTYSYKMSKTEAIDFFGLY